MNLYLTAPAFLLAFLVQTSVLAALGFSTLRPDLLLLLVVAIGVLGGAQRAVPWAIVAGLLLDTASAGPFGANLLAFLLVALTTVLRETNLVEGKLTLSLGLAFTASVLYGATYMLILQLSGRSVEWLPGLQWLVLPVAAVNTALMPAAYWLTRQMALPNLTRGASFARL